MGMYVVATVGTSALTNRPPRETPDGWRDPRHDVPIEPGAVWQMRDDPADPVVNAWVEASVAANSHWLETFSAARRDGERERARAALALTTAELASLALLQADAAGPGGALDGVLLVASDTETGRLAVRIVERVMEEVWPTTRCERAIAAGLDPEDPERFLRVGLGNLQTIVRRACEKHRGDRVVLNVTGGLKGGIPFLTAIAMRNALDLVYLFERSPALTWVDGARLARAVAGPDPVMRLSESASLHGY